MLDLSVMLDCGALSVKKIVPASLPTVAMPFVPCDFVTSELQNGTTIYHTTQRDNARNNHRCTQARKTTHGLDGQHQDMDRTARGKVNRGRLKNRTEQNSLLMFN